MDDDLLVDGMFVKAPREGSPDFVKGSISVQVDKAVEYLQKHRKEDGYVNMDILLSRKNTLYLKRNTYVKEKTND